MKDVVVNRKPRKHRFRKVLYPTAAIVIAAALGFLVAFNYLNLSKKIGDRLQTELQSRGISIGMRKLYLDPLGNIIAKDVKVFQTTENKVTRIFVNRVHFNLNWFSWWRGQPFLNRATIQNATLNFPITSDTGVELNRVDADVEFKSNEMMVRSAQGQLGKIYFHAAGTIKLDSAMPAQKPATSEEMQKRAQSWKNISSELESLSTPIKLNLEFEIAMSDPLAGKARFLLNAHHISWKTVLWREVTLRANYEDRVVKLERFKLQLARGGLESQGVFDLKTRTGKLDYRSDMDLTLLRGILPKNISHGMKEVAFQTLPVNEGIWECRWENSFSFFWRDTADWKDFSVQKVPFSNFHSVISFDGKRLLISSLNLKSARGALSLECLMDEKGEIHGTFQSSLDPTIFRDFGGPEGQELLNNIVFKKDPPLVSAKISGALPNVKLIGDIELKDFSYRNGRGTVTHLALIQSPFTLENKVLKLPDLHVTRVEGENGSANIEYDFNTLLVIIKNGKTNLDVQKFSPVFGGKLEKYVQPYRFTENPQLQINGIVDLKTEKQTDLHILCSASQGMEYDFLGKTLRFKKIEGDINVVSQKLTVNIKHESSLFDGKIFGSIELDLETPGPDYRAKFQIEKMNFQQILITYFNKLDVTGTCSGEFNLTGKLDDIRSIKGPGTFKVEEGDVYQIPVFGALSEVFSAIIPGAGYSKAEDANSEFHFEDGKIQIDNIEIFSLLFAVIGYGSYDYINDNVDLSMRVNVRGPIGIPFFFVSKLFEYEGHGTLSNTKWDPKAF